jgi:hypothetical protein
VRDALAALATFRLLSQWNVLAFNNNQANYDRSRLAIASRCRCGNEGQSIVSVYAVPGASAKEAQFFEPPQVVTAPIFGMSAIVAAPATATISGNPGPNEYLTFVVDGIHAYSAAAGPSDTNLTMAATLDRVSNLGRPIPVCPSCGGHALTAERTMTRQMPDTREAYRIV